ncbi:MAG: hypothetical protein ACRBK7_33140 [Acidimicrobiales bacterium]
MSDQIFWYITRSSSLVAWLSASLSILVGLMTSSRLLGRRPTIPWLVDLHRMLAAMSVVFLGIHMLSLWLDSFVQFGLAELLIPWVATVPGLTGTSMALGVIAAWLLAAVQLSSLVRDRLPNNVWHTIHLLSYGTLIAGTLHAIQTGSDVDNPVVVGIGVSVLTAIFLTTIVRLVRLRSEDRYAEIDESLPTAMPGGTRPGSPGQPR